MQPKRGERYAGPSHDPASIRIPSARTRPLIKPSLETLVSTRTDVRRAWGQHVTPRTMSHYFIAYSRRQLRLDLTFFFCGVFTFVISSPAGDHIER